MQRTHLQQQTQRQLTPATSRLTRPQLARPKEGEDDEGEEGDEGDEEKEQKEIEQKEIEHKEIEQKEKPTETANEKDQKRTHTHAKQKWVKLVNKRDNVLTRQKRHYTCSLKNKQCRTKPRAEEASD